MFLGNPKGARKFDARVAGGSFVSWKQWVLLNGRCPQCS